MCVCVCSVADCTALLIQQNDGSGGFNRSWAEYKVGFGDPSGNYWLGNDLLYQLTANYFRYKLRFDLQQNGTGKWYYAEYSTFIVLSEAENYTLLVSGFSGNASHDAFGVWHNGLQFTTLERDNDRAYLNCAALIGGGFWWRNCGGCHVNAARSTGRFYWLYLPGGRHLHLSRMWLQCKQ